MPGDSAELQFLKEGVARLLPLMEEHGFVFHPGPMGRSSGGPFATGFFRRNSLEIGLIVRDTRSLGCPSYSSGKGYAGHDDVIWALGRDGEGHLVEGEYLEYVDRKGGYAFDALEADLRCLILPALRESEGEFLDAIAAAHRLFQDILSGGEKRARALRSRQKYPKKTE